MRYKRMKILLNFFYILIKFFLICDVKKYNMLTILSENFSLVNIWINELRNVDIQIDRMRFRRNLERIGEVSAFEISKKMDYEEGEITTPLDKIKVKEIAVQPVVTTILRA